MRAGHAETIRHIRVRKSLLDTQHDELPIAIAEPRQRRRIALDILFVDDLLQWRGRQVHWLGERTGGAPPSRLA